MFCLAQAARNILDIYHVAVLPKAFCIISKENFDHLNLKTRSCIEE